MPYPKKYRKRQYKRKRTYKPKGASLEQKIMSVAKVATSGLSLARLVYGLLNVEMKKVDLAHSPANLTSAIPYAAPMIAAIPEGSSEVQRNGNKIELKSVYLEGNLTRSASSTIPATIVRVVVCYIKQNNAADNSSSVFSDVYLASTVNALRNLDHTDDWGVLYSKDFTLTADKPSVHIQRAFKFPPNSMKYKFQRGSTSGAANTVEDKCLYIAICSNDPVNLQDKYLGTRATYLDN